VGTARAERWNELKTDAAVNLAHTSQAYARLIELVMQNIRFERAKKRARALTVTTPHPYRLDTSMQFKVTTEGANNLGLVELCQRFADEQWLPAHVLPNEAAESVLDRFKRAVAQELELLTVETMERETGPQTSD
jgi:hypothetical protein